MPKINANGNATYDGHQGVVTNAVGEQFEVNPSRDLDGERPEGYTEEPVGDFEQSSPPGVSGNVTAIDENTNEAVDLDQRDNDQSPRLVDHRQSEGQKDEGRTAAKKSAPPATKK